VAEPVDSARYARVQELFIAICGLPPKEQAAAIDRACAGDTALKDEITSLLKHHRDGSLFAERAPRALDQGISSDDPRADPSSDDRGRGGETRLAFNRESRATWNEEQRRLLHQRVRVLTLILLIMVGSILLRVMVLVGGFPRVAMSPTAGMLAGSAVLLVLSVVVLRLRSPSWAALRRCEVALLASACVVPFSWHYAWLTNGLTLASPPSEALSDLLRDAYWIISPGDAIHIRKGSSLLSFQLINHWGPLATLYCVIVPNTLRRGAVMLAAITLVAMAVVPISAAHNPGLRPHVAASILSCLYVSVFGGAGLYISIQFQALRRAVFDAKQVGQYRLKELLGKGAMGEVYLAQHRLLRRPCAVKVIRADQIGSREWMARFEREVQAMAQLTHPNTVEVYDFGCTDDNLFFYAMEYLPGWTLDALVRAHGPLPPGRVVHLLRQVCGALAEAHEKGLIHRDIKPSNILVCERGGMKDVVKLLDFGLVYVQAGEPAPGEPPPAGVGESAAQPAGRAGESHMTRAGQLLGTPAYMAPEQVRGEQPDARSDIYSLGGVAFFLLTGKPPFEGDTLEDLCLSHLHAPAPRLRDRAPEIPADLEAVITRCLAKEREARFQHVNEMAAALETTGCSDAWGSGEAQAWWRTHAMTPEGALAARRRVGFSHATEL
jgi:serine/threonine protein kinase